MMRAHNAMIDASAEPERVPIIVTLVVLLLLFAIRCFDSHKFDLHSSV